MKLNSLMTLIDSICRGQNESVKGVKYFLSVMIISVLVLTLTVCDKFGETPEKP